MNAHSKVNELEQFKEITCNLHFIICQNILLLDSQQYALLSPQFSNF